MRKKTPRGFFWSFIWDAVSRVFLFTCRSFIWPICIVLFELFVRSTKFFWSFICNYNSCLLLSRQQPIIVFSEFYLPPAHSFFRFEGEFYFRFGRFQSFQIKLQKNPLGVFFRTKYIYECMDLCTWYVCMYVSMYACMYVYMYV